jgi:hypothetical protein
MVHALRDGYTARQPTPHLVVGLPTRLPRVKRVGPVLARDESTYIYTTIDFA